MKIIAVVVMFLIMSVSVVRAEVPSLGDQVSQWVKQSGLRCSQVRGDYSVEDAVDGKGPHIAYWNVAQCGPQPTQSQLQAVWTALTTQQAVVATYKAALAAGIAVSSTSAPSLNATYALDRQTQFNITAEIVSIAVNSAFTNGAGSKAWPDATGGFHTFTVAQFKTFATAIAQYVDALAMTEQALMAGQTAAWPSSSQAIP